MMRLVTLAEYIVLAVVAPESLRKIAGEWYVIAQPSASSDQLPPI